MLFSERHIDLLRLLCWCQYASFDDLKKLSNDAEVKNLIGTGMVKWHRASRALVLAKKGKELLQMLYAKKLPDISPTYHAKAIERRLRLSRLMLTAYKAGIEIFTTDIAELQAVPSLFLSAVTRGRGGDPWGGTRVGALLHLPDMVAAMHFVTPSIGRSSFVDEINVLVNQSAGIKDAARTFLFAGESYASILAEIEDAGQRTDIKLIPYGEAYHESPYPVYLLPCSDIGAKQLRLMSVPNYRQWFTHATLQSEFFPAPEDVPEWDAIFRGIPFIMAADMDLRRIDRAIEAAQRLGYPSVSMAALEPQAKEVLYPRYADTGKAKVFVWTAEMEAGLFGDRLRLRPLETVPYRNAKGEYVNAPLIQADRKSGRPAGKKTRKLV